VQALESQLAALKKREGRKGFVYLFKEQPYQEDTGAAAAASSSSQAVPSSTSNSFSYYKLGLSNSPDDRVQQLKVGNPRALVIVKMQAVECKREAEDRLHRRFAAFGGPYARGTVGARHVPSTEAGSEWFSFRDSEIADVVAAMQSIAADIATELEAAQ
jgi:hypothetical protein